MRPGIITCYGNHGRHRQGDVIFAEPTNRAMRRLTAKQDKQAAQMERAPRQAPNAKQLMTNKSVRKSIA